MGIYLSEDFAAIYKKAEVRLEYLFLYLPNYNLIEKSFSILKA